MALMACRVFAIAVRSNHQRHDKPPISQNRSQARALNACNFASSTPAPLAQRLERSCCFVARTKLGPSIPPSSCHKWGPYLVSPYEESGNRCNRGTQLGCGALEPTPQRRERSRHVTMVFAAADCRLRANLEL